MFSCHQLRLMYDVLPVDMGARVLEINGPDAVCGVTKHYRNTLSYDISTLLEAQKNQLIKKGERDDREIVDLLDNSDLVPEGEFDLIVIHGALDSLPTKGWGGISKRDLVQMAYRKLKDNGMLVIAVSNKFDAKYLLSNYLNPLRGGEEKNTQTVEKKMPRLSSNGYSRMLKSVGFKCVEIFIAIPSHHDVRQLISYGSVASYAYFHREYHKSICADSFVKQVIKRIVLVCRLNRFIESSYVIWSRK